MLEKTGRAYHCLLLQTRYDYFVCIPFRTEMRHENGYKFKRSQRSRRHQSGLDFSKMVIVQNGIFLDKREGVIDHDEYIELIREMDRIVRMADRYIDDYCRHISGQRKMDAAEFNRKYRFSTLKYFHAELGLKDSREKRADSSAGNREETMGFQIAIDGPAGAGKSTVAKRCAQELQFVYVDTGAMYRAIALYLLRTGTDPEDEGALRKALDEIDVGIAYESGAQQILLNGENVTGLIRTEAVSDMASKSSAKDMVRRKLDRLQLDLAEKYDVLMDGRDIGTQILPNAQLKIYLTASVQARAKRRWLENKEKGITENLADVEADIRARDERDMNREVSPLKQAKDAVLVDSSDMSIEQVVERIVSLARERMVASAEDTSARTK